ncbi:MAG: hypothetical protein GY898_15955 [Proteobacteria bacterium]|nr:hypothetical protein [Pseudomonadota bacterium]
MRTLWMLLAVGLLVGCNPAQTIIDDASAQYATGDKIGAARSLEKLQRDHPDDVLVTNGRLLAVQWLTEAAEAEEDPGRRKALLREVLEWEPDHSRIWTRLCEMEFDAEAWEAAQGCLDEGRAHLPKDQRDRFEEILTKRADDAAGAAERAALLASDDAADWRALRRDHAGSDEAAQAQTRLLTSSICEDLFRFVEPLKLEGVNDPRAWGPAVAKETTRNGQVNALTEARDGARRLRADVEQMQAEAAEHGVLNEAEEATRASIEAAYASLLGPLEALEAAFAKKKYKMEDRTGAVAAFDEALEALLGPIQTTRREAGKDCEPG